MKRSKYLSYGCAGFLLLLFSGKPITAQELSRTSCSSAGKYKATSGFSLSYNIGETVVYTGVAGTFTLLQGFEQPDVSVITSVNPSASILFAHLFPNPVKDILYIHQAGDVRDAYVNIEIFDIQGRLIRRENEQYWSPDQPILINLSGYAATIYVVRILTQANDLITATKIIKE